MAKPKLVSKGGKDANAATYNTDPPKVEEQAVSVLKPKA